MTGFGRARGRVAGREVEVVISSLNHRFIEVFTVLPDGLDWVEVRLRELLRERLRRGKITCRVSCLEEDGEMAMEEFLTTIELFRKKTGFNITPSLADFLIFMKEKRERRAAIKEKEWKELEKIVKAAIREVDKMRESEGEKIKSEIEKSMGVIKRVLVRIEKRKKKIESSPAEKTSHAVEGGMAEDGVKRSDFSEEFSRFEGHFRLLKRALREKEAGKKIGFIQQEMLREITTLSNKACDFRISAMCIRIKQELEKIREHAQNIL